MIQVERRCAQRKRPAFLWAAVIIANVTGSALAQTAGAGAGAQAEASSGKPAAAVASRPIIFQMHWYPQSQFAGYMMALKKGFFRHEGLAKLEIRWSGAGERPFDLLAEGKADYCTGWLADAIVEKDRGLPLVHLAQVIPQSSLMLIAWRRSGIDTPQQLTGKRVGLWGGNFDVQATAFFRKYGIRPIVVPQSTSMVPFLRGAVDVASAMHYNEYHKLIEAGVSPEELCSFRFADHGFVFPEDGIYCTARTRIQRADVSAAVVRACRQGWEYALANEAETLDVVMENCRAANVRTNRNHQRWMLRSIRDAMRRPDSPEAVSWGSLSEAAYSEVVRLLVDQALIEEAPAFHEFHQRPETALGGKE
jgi:NitT/TauT family transport system substrate-binding protein